MPMCVYVCVRACACACALVSVRVCACVSIFKPFPFYLCMIAQGEGEEGGVKHLETGAQEGLSWGRVIHLSNMSMRRQLVYC